MKIIELLKIFITNIFISIKEILELFLNAILCILGYATPMIIYIVLLAIGLYGFNLLVCLVIFLVTIIWAFAVARTLGDL